MDLSYFQKINNTYQSKSKQETDLYLLNRHVDECFADTIDYHIVKRNGEPFELLIIKDTDGNTFKKKIKAKHPTPFNLGDYIEWNGQIWLITLLDPNEKTYHSGYMYLCTIPLRWQNSVGDIVERYAYSEDFTKYSGGTTGNNVIKIGDNQYGLTLPIDSETKKLKRDMRFPIDFEDAEQPDIYELGNRKVNLSNYDYFNRGGIMTITLSYDAFNAEKDKRVLYNGREIWLCDYIDPTTIPSSSQNPDESVLLSAKIIGKETIRCGVERTYSVEFTDKDNVIIENIDFKWNVVSDFEVKRSDESENPIKLYVEDDSAIDESFLLQVIVNDTVVAELEITVTDLL